MSKATFSPTPNAQRKPSPEEVHQALAFVDGVLGAAGHSVDDPETREILRRQAAEETTR